MMPLFVNYCFNFLVLFSILLQLLSRFVLEKAFIKERRSLVTIQVHEFRLLAFAFGKECPSCATVSTINSDRQLFLRVTV